MASRSSICAAVTEGVRNPGSGSIPFFILVGNQLSTGRSPGSLDPSGLMTLKPGDFVGNSIMRPSTRFYSIVKVSKPYFENSFKRLFFKKADAKEFNAEFKTNTGILNSKSSQSLVESTVVTEQRINML